MGWGWVTYPDKEAVLINTWARHPGECVPLASRQEVDDLIEALRKAADEVWPEEDPLEDILKTFVRWAGNRRGKAAELAKKASGPLDREDRLELAREIQAHLRATRKPPMALLARLSEVVGP